MKDFLIYCSFSRRFHWNFHRRHFLPTCCNGCERGLRLALQAPYEHKFASAARSVTSNVIGSRELEREILSRRPPATKPPLEHGAMPPRSRMALPNGGPPEQDRRLSAARLTQ